MGRNSSIILFVINSIQIHVFISVSLPSLLPFFPAYPFYTKPRAVLAPIPNWETDSGKYRAQVVKVRYHAGRREALELGIL